jgi:Uma2 family endonuclease
MITTGIRMSAEDLLHLPDNGMRHELIRGELYEIPPAGGEHGFVSGRAHFRLALFLEQHSAIGGAVFAAETGFRLARDPDTVRAPDAAYVSAENLPRARVRGYPDLAPDLVVEVVSPNDTATEIQSKVGEWLRAGVSLV